MPNYNPESGVPYGVIACNSLDADLLDELWYTHGTNLSYEAAFEELRDEITAEVNAEHEDDAERDECDIQHEIDHRLEKACDYIQIDEPTIEGEYEGVQYHISWLGGAPLLWVFESPHINPHAQCSPCVPGAGDLDAEGDVLCYDVPDDWRRDENH